MLELQMNRDKLQQKSAPSDLQPQRGYASSLSGQLPSKKRRVSPFDRLGAKQFQPEKGQKSESYAG